MDPALPQMLLGEAQGLEALRCATELLKVPKVLHVGNRRDGAELSRRAFPIFFPTISHVLTRGDSRLPRFGDLDEFGICACA